MVRDFHKPGAGRTLSGESPVEAPSESQGSAAGEPAFRNGLPLLPGRSSADPVTAELVAELRDEQP